MDDKRRSDIDLTSFDLTDFKQYFEEEDAQKEVEAQEKARQEAEAEALRMEEEERVLQQELQLRLEEERKAQAEFEARKRLEFEKREKEEAHVAAEKAAAAALAAKKAEEEKLKQQQKISAKLLEQADVDNSYDAPSSQSTQKESQVKFADFASILDIENNQAKDDLQETESDEMSGFFADKEKKKNILFTAICIALCIATVVCSCFAVFNFLKKPEGNNSSVQAPVQNVAPYDPYGSLETKYNQADYPQSISPQLKAIYSENDDVVGWLTINGTAIDYPITQDSNNKYYLYNHNVYGESARYGTPFIDFRCNKFDLSKNTVIYGHHMNNKAHFGSLDGYQEVEYFKKHPLIKYETLTNSYTFKVYAVFYATTKGSVDGGYVFDYYNPNMSSSNFGGYIQMLKQYALYTTEAGLRNDDKIITLSTCTHVYDSLKSGGVDARLVVVGRLLRQGESESMNTENVLINSNYRRPQIWYDKKGKTNPYSAYRSWKPAV